MRRDLKLRPRRVGHRPTRPTALIVCEGEKTEPRYFQALRQRLRVGGIDVHPMGKDPGRLIEEADKIRRSHERGGGAKYDAVWVVFDTERHGTYPNLPNLVQTAVSKGIKVAHSCPCFEVWLLLHFDFSTGSCLDCKQVETKLGTHLPNYEKVSFPTDQLMDRLTTAVENAGKLRAYHERVGNRELSGNPGTKVDLLVSWIKATASG